MVAVKTGFSSPSMPGMPAPMQPMMPMGGPGTFPSAALPAGQTPVPPSMPPMPLAGFPPPPVKSPMAQQVSNAPRRRRFGDSLEGMLGRNVFAPQMQRPMPTPMMPRPMAMGGAVQYFANGGNANQQAAASMMSAGIGNVGGKAITSGAQSVQDSFASSAAKRRKRRRKKQQRLAAERAAAEQAIRDAEAAALAASQAAQQNNPNIAGPMESALQNFGGTAFQSAASSPVTPEVFIPPSGGIDATPPGFGAMPPSTGMSEGLEIVNQMQDAANLQAALGAGIDATPPGFGSVPPVSPVGIQAPDRSIDAEIAGPSLTFDDDPAFTQGIIPSEVVPENPFAYDIGAIGLGDNEDITNPDYPNPMAPIPDVYYGGSTFEESEGMKSRVFPSLSYQQMLSQTGEPSEEDLEAFRASGYKFPQGPFGGPISPPRDDTFEQNTFSPNSEQKLTYESGRGIGDRGFDPEGTQIAPEAATTTGFSYFPEDTTGVMPPVTREKDDSFAESMFEFTPNPYAVGGGFDVTAPRETDEGTRFAYPEDKPLVPTPEDKFGNQPLNRTGVDPQADQYRSSVNAAEAAYLQEALGNMKDPNFAEQVINKIIRNLTLGMFDPDDPQKRADAKAILDAYKQTGKFVYDTEENAIDLSTQEGLKQLEALTKGAGIEPAVIGVRDDKGNIVDFDDGTGFRNIMGDYNPVFSKDGQVFSGGSDTQNILTGSTDVFGGDDTTTNITTGGGDDGGSDTGTDTGVDTGHTVDEDGNIVCNTPGYIYNPETKICEPEEEEEEVDGTPGSGINRGTSGESFEDVLKRVVVAAPDVAPISANVQPMQEGGMAGLNRAADNFLKALAG